MEKFNEVSYNLNGEIMTMASPRSGEILVEKYIVKSEKIINQHMKIPFFPLLDKEEKDEVTQRVLNEINFFKIRLAKYEDGNIKKSNQMFLSVTRNFKSAFPSFQISGAEWKKITSPIIPIKKRVRKVTPNSPSKQLIPKRKRVKSVRSEKDRRKENRNSKRDNKNNSSVSSETIPIAEAGKHVEEEVRVYLKTGRSLKGIIKLVEREYLSLLVSFKGGTFTARIIIRDIDEIIKVVNRNPFLLFMED